MMLQDKSITLKCPKSTDAKQTIRSGQWSNCCRPKLTDMAGNASSWINCDCVLRGMTVGSRLFLIAD
jgi:hypothetical protein